MLLHRGHVHLFVAVNACRALVLRYLIRVDQNLELQRQLALHFIQFQLFVAAHAVAMHFQFRRHSQSAGALLEFVLGPRHLGRVLHVVVDQAKGVDKFRRARRDVLIEVEVGSDRVAADEATLYGRQIARLVI